MTLSNKITQSHLNARYTLNKNYSIIRFFPLADPTQTYFDFNKLIEFIIKRKIDIEMLGYEIRVITISQKIKHDVKGYYFSATGEEGAEYVNVYPASFYEFNYFSELYYQWVNLQTGECFIGAQFVLTQLHHPDEKIAFLAKKLLDEKTLVL